MTPPPPSPENAARAAAPQTPTRSGTRLTPQSPSSAPGPRAWRLVLGLDKPLSLNDRHGVMAHARAKRTVRQAAGYAALALRIGPQPHVHVRIVYEPALTRRRDTDNLWATGKPAIDGLVDAGVVPDDTPQYVTRHEPRIADPNPRVLGNRVWLHVWRDDTDQGNKPFAPAPAEATLFGGD